MASMALGAVLVFAAVRAGAINDWLPWLFLALYFVVFYVTIAAGVKRLHDRDRSGAWLILYYGVPLFIRGAAYEYRADSMLPDLVALAVFVWLVVELGCLRGTQGPSQYGPSPPESRHVVATDH
jgi:uncharacterized membrane protein YhaH (DUF805 family)